MKSLTQLFVIGAWALSAFSHPSVANQVTFMKSNLKSVQELAAKEGKLYFVSFVAAWCKSCRQMDETTYTDAGLAYYVSQNYLATKVDVDDFDGVIFKNQYNVKTVPTIIIFNAAGKIVGKHEGEKNAAQLLHTLKAYDKPEHRGLKSAPAPPISRPALVPEKPAAPPSNPAPAVSTAAVPSKTAAAPAAGTGAQMTGSGLFRFDVSRQPSKGFSIQIGVFQDYENVLREAAKYKEQFKQPVLVNIDKLDNKTVYRVMIGDFATQPEATSFIATARAQGIDGYVRDLATIR